MTAQPDERADAVTGSIGWDEDEHAAAAAELEVARARRELPDRDAAMFVATSAGWHTPPAGTAKPIPSP
jgi:hypothetical protein